MQRRRATAGLVRTWKVTGVWPGGEQATVTVMATSEGVATAQGRRLLASDYPPGARVVAVNEQSSALA